jgi:hypothetical protein
VEIQVLRPSRWVFFKQQPSGEVTPCSIVIKQKGKKCLVFVVTDITYLTFSLISTTRMSNLRTRHRLHIFRRLLPLSCRGQAKWLYCQVVLLSRGSNVKWLYCHVVLLSRGSTVTWLYCHVALLSSDSTVTWFYWHVALLSRGSTVKWLFCHVTTVKWLYCQVALLSRGSTAKWLYCLVALLSSGSTVKWLYCQVALLSPLLCQFFMLRVWSGLEIFQKLVSWFKSSHRNHIFSTSLFIFLRKEKLTHDKLVMKLAVLLVYTMIPQLTSDPANEFFG